MHSQSFKNFREIFLELSQKVKFFNFGLDYLDVHYFPGQITSKEEISKILREHFSIKMYLEIKGVK